MLQVVGVEAVHDIDVVPCVAQGVRQAVDVHGITPETVGGVKSREMEDVERSTHAWVATFRITLRICRAAASHVSWRAAANPA